MTEPSNPPSSEDEPGHAPRSQDVRVRTLRSEELFEGRREVLIEHAGELYRLRLTRNGKLILQK